MAAENKELRNYITSVKQLFQQYQKQQQAQFLENQKNYYNKRPSKNIKKLFMKNSLLVNQS